MGINTSCPCSNITHQFENDETTDSSAINNGYNSGIKHKQLSKNEIVCSQTYSSQKKQTKICIIPTNMIDLCFQTHNILAINEGQELYYERVCICNYLNSSSFTIVILQTIKGNEDLCSYFFKKQKQYMNIYQITSVNFLSDNIPLIKETLYLELNNMVNKEYYLIGSVCVDDTKYKLLFKQKSICNDKLVSHHDDYIYQIEVFESKNNVINQKEIEIMINENKDKTLICFIQYSLKQSDKSAFFFVYSNKNRSNGSQNTKIKVNGFVREQIPTERFIRNLGEQINEIDITSAFGSVDCIYISYL